MRLLLINSKQNLVFISPWNQRVRVPPFDNSPQQFVEVMLAERGASLLQEPRALTAMAIAITQKSVPAGNNANSIREQRRASLKEVAKSFGLTPAEVDQAIRALGQRTSDPYERGLAALYSANYSEASHLLSTSLKERRSEFERLKGELVETLELLGQAKYEQGKYEEAISEFREALEIDPDNATVLNKLGKALTKSGRYDEAATVFLKGLEITEKTLGNEHPNYASVLNNLAELYETQGKYLEAEKEYRRALAIREKLGPEHPAVASSYDSLGRLYYLRGNYVEASAFHRLALSIREKALGPDHPDVAVTLNNIALLYMSQGKLVQAEPLYLRALAMLEKTLGPDHPQFAALLNNLGMLYRTQEKLAQAEPLYLRALAIQEKALGPDHPDVARSLSRLAELYTIQGKYTEAERFFKQGLNIIEKSSMNGSIYEANLLENYSLLLSKLGREAEAIVMKKRAEKIRGKNE